MGRGHPAQVTLPSCLYNNSLPRWSERRSALRKSSESRPRRTERKSRGLRRDHWAPPTPPCPPPLIYSSVINVFSAFFSCAHSDSRRQTALPASCGLSVGGAGRVFGEKPAGCLVLPTRGELATYCHVQDAATPAVTLPVTSPSYSITILRSTPALPAGAWSTRPKL